MKNHKALAPSILSANFTNLATAITETAEGGATYLHLDVMDGHFVPNISFGIPIVQSLRSFADENALNLTFDAHLMIANPKSYIKPFADAGADLITFHYETCENAEEARGIISLIRGEGKRVGVAINPHTHEDVLKPLLPEIDMALVMSVVPGFGGQGFMPHTLDKARKIRGWADEQNLPLNIQMDGGINLDNIKTVADAGANIIVVGSAIFAHEDITAKTREFVDKIT
ncbi:MAG: ribulose-phosphate 3-epimerase [Defluviitaleaceae bacterium]|nr:ribulose-phosphate 3-epimerase [Defluviitaleaceae bacterium]